MALLAIDIARLVHHHLLKEGYENTANCFINECAYLKGLKPVKSPYRLPSLLGPSFEDLIESYFKTKDFVIEELNLLKTTAFREQDTLLVLTKILLENLKSQTSLVPEIQKETNDACVNTEVSSGFPGNVDNTHISSIEVASKETCEQGKTQGNPALDNFLKDCIGISSKDPTPRGNTDSTACHDGELIASPFNAYVENSKLPVSKCMQVSVPPIAPQSSNPKRLMVRTKHRLLSKRPRTSKSLRTDIRNIHATKKIASNFQMDLAPNNSQVTPAMAELMKIAQEACKSLNTENEETTENSEKITTHSQLASSCVRNSQYILVKTLNSRKATKPLVRDIDELFIHQNECMQKPFCNTNPFPKLPVETNSLPSVDSSTVTEFCENGSLAKRPRLEKDEHLQYLLTTLAQVVSDVNVWCKEEILE